MLFKIFIFVTKAGIFVFGSGLAIVPFLYGGVVKEYHWLNERQFIDAVAVAMITPGPVVITVGFIGYLVAGLPGAIVATATASMNWRSFSQWCSFTTLPYRNGTIARPLPNTKAPASPKNRAICKRSGQSITEATPAAVGSSAATASIVPEWNPRFGGAFTSHATTPAIRKSHTISDSVTTVTAAATR